MAAFRVCLRTAVGLALCTGAAHAQTWDAYADWSNSGVNGAGGWWFYEHDVQRVVNAALRLA